MDVIKILPHHVGHYFEVFYLDRNPEEGNSWYDNEKAKQNSEAAIKTVVSNPSQLVQIVSRYDSFCQICPRNQRGENYSQPENTCVTYEEPNLSRESETAKFLGIEDLVDADPITAGKLFERLEPLYKRIFTEEPNSRSSNLSPREYFRVTSAELLFGRTAKS